MNRASMFASLYSGDRRACPSLGDDYKPPETFPHAEDVLVAALPKSREDSDGYAVEVYECRCPATFWKLVAKPTPNSMGEMQPGFVISTGSGGDEMLDLIGRLARLATEGMIGCDVHSERTQP